MNDKTLDLLGELVRLLRKYGPEEFGRLAALLGDEELLRSLRTALTAVAGAAPARPEKPKDEAQDESDASSDPRLEAIRTRLMDTAAYPHLQDLVDEAQRIGVRIPQSGFKSRKHAVHAIVTALRGKSAGDMGKALGELRVPEQKGTLQEWSKIIMERKR